MKSLTNVGFAVKLIFCRALLEASSKQQDISNNNTDSRKNHSDSDVEDDAMEICENINDLLDEGVEVGVKKFLVCFCYVCPE